MMQAGTLELQRVYLMPNQALLRSVNCRTVSLTKPQAAVSTQTFADMFDSSSILFQVH